jgi:energy-coupling factor transporter ATP-binding protein EcfA2
VTGPSGSGKSTTCALLRGLLPECITFDGDALWHTSFWEDRGHWFYGAWMRVASNVQQSGRPSVLCTAAMPQVWEDRPERRFFRDVHVLALICDDAVLQERIAARGPLDETLPTTFMEETLTFNKWLREHVEHIDTSTMGPADTAARVAAWVRARL